MVKNKKAYGVKLTNKKKIITDAVILTTGTYMRSLVHIGKTQKKQGPQGFKYSNSLSKNLVKLGFKMIRLKTGTSPRIDKNSIDYSQMIIEPGTDMKLAFSYHTNKYIPFKKQLPCYLLYTNDKTHKLIQENISDSSMYSGQICGIGPRYCPSIEDKIFRFKDKSRHQLFLEPESLNLNTMYLAGFSTSFSKTMQDKLISTLSGLQNCKIVNYGYAIEYDALDSFQLYSTLETKLIKNLYSAGQINGTSGYEEAAGQGLMAGINAVLNLENKEPFILKRDEAYIGVMIDDIVTKGITEPYRLLTSRAEHRLLLRNDNTQDRLIEYAKKLKLINQNDYKKYVISKTKRNKIIDFLKNKKIGEFSSFKKNTPNTNFSLYQYLKRPEIKLNNLLKIIKYKNLKLTDAEINTIEIQIKYEGYINNYLKAMKSVGNLENVKLPVNFDYKKVLNLSNEAIDKLTKIKPSNLQQAFRVSGITFPDIVAIKTYLDNDKKYKK